MKIYIAAGLVSLSIAALTVAKAADKPRVFALVPKTISVPFYNDVERGMREEAKKIGVQAKFTGPPTADAAQQVQVLQDLVSQGVDGIAVAPMDADSVIGVVASARKKGIPVITFDSDSPKADRIAFVGTNNLAGGEEGGKAFQKLMPKGKFAIITGGLAAANLNERIKGFREFVNGDNYTEVPGSPFACNDDASKAIQIIQDVLTRHPDLNGFFFSGGWPLFAPEAYIKAIGSRVNDIKAHKFVVVSFDTLPEQLKLLKEGYCNTLIGQRPVAMGAKSIDMLNDLVDKKSVPPVVDTGVDVVDWSNVDQFLK
jgi:ribose transport system substrate-binding protein